MRMASEVAAMLELHRRGWGIRRIAAELGAERKTVRTYVRAGRWSGYKPRTRRQVAGLGAQIAPDTAAVHNRFMGGGDSI